MQNTVKNFNNNRKCHQKEVPTFARILNIQSELGELSKSYLEETSYGTKEFSLTADFKEEFGDVLYTLLSLADELNLSCEECLSLTLEKLESRMKNNYSMKSGS